MFSYVRQEKCAAFRVGSCLHFGGGQARFVLWNDGAGIPCPRSEYVSRKCNRFVESVCVELRFVIIM